MGFFRKKQEDVSKPKHQGKHAAADTPSSYTTAAGGRTFIPTLVSPASEDSSSSGKKLRRGGRQDSTNSRGSRGRRSNGSATATSSNTATTVASSSTSILLNSLNIVATDDIEITTFESQQALVEQREAIRRQLFDPPTTTAASSSHLSKRQLQQQQQQQQQQLQDGSRRSILYRTATNASQEILPNGNIIPDHAPPYSYYHKLGSAGSIGSRKLSVELASLPLELVNSSIDTDHEESIEDYSRQRIVPIELAARSYDDSMDKRKAAASASVVDKKVVARSRTDPSEMSMSNSLSSSPIRLDMMISKQRSSSPLAAATISTQSNTNQSTDHQQTSLNASSSSIPMDERRVDQELDYQRNRGKSPLKGMPDDERLEYQRDEIDHDNNDEMVLIDDQEEEEEDDEEEMDDSNEGGEDDTLYSGMVRSSRGGGVTRRLLAGGALVAAAVGWGANAVENVCMGEDDDELDEDPLHRDGRTTLQKSASNQRQQQQTTTKSRPTYLSEAECKRFLRRITRNGFVLLNLVLNNNNENGGEVPGPDDLWTGRTVTMCIAKGSQEHYAQLEWTTVTGGQNHEIFVSSVDLMDILTIDTDGIPDDDEALETTTDNGCIFTITTDDGQVFLFEANSKEERDRIVNGLKTIIARWARHMVTGDVTATTELYASHLAPKLAPSTNSELSSSLPNPTYTMNRLAHRLLDL